MMMITQIVLEELFLNIPHNVYHHSIWDILWLNFKINGKNLIKMTVEYVLAMEFQKDIVTAILGTKIVVEIVIYLKIVILDIAKKDQQIMICHVLDVME